MCGVGSSCTASFCFRHLRPRKKKKKMESAWVVNGWRAMFEESGYPEWVVAGVGSFVLHESLYFLFHIPYLISDLIPSHQKYKVQPHKPNDWPLYKRCLKQLFFSHIVIQLPLILVSHPIFELLGIRTEAELIPSWWTIVGSCVLFLIIEDFYFYWIHRYGRFHLNLSSSFFFLAPIHPVAFFALLFRQILALGSHLPLHPQDPSSPRRALRPRRRVRPPGGDHLPRSWHHARPVPLRHPPLHRVGLALPPPLPDR